MPFFFFTFLALLLHTYIGYPFILKLISIFSKRSKTNSSYHPAVSLVIPVYNEGVVIKRKIENSLLLNYPEEKVEIIIASDGSSDDTKNVVEQYSKKGVKFFEFSRGGKLATINRVLPKTKGDIIVLTDANAMFAEDALQKLASRFVDESVGVVTGVEKITAQSDYISRNEQSYWSYETKLKELESKIYSTIGANGPIYAIRRELFPSIPSHLNLCDDMTISLSVVQKGKRIILEPKAVAFEDTSLTLKEEWRRKVRISTRAWQALFYHKNLLNPFTSPVALPLIFHKIFRWSTVPLMGVLFISNLFIEGSFYTIFLGGQILLHTLSIVGIVLLWRGLKLPSMFTFMSYFLFTNCAQVVGLYNSLFNKGKPSWQPIERANKK